MIALMIDYETTRLHVPEDCHLLCTIHSIHQEREHVLILQQNEFCVVEQNLIT
jgi:hypothetical protein